MRATNVVLALSVAFIMATLLTVSFVGKPRYAEAAKPTVEKVEKVRQIPLTKTQDRVELPEFKGGKDDRLLEPIPVKSVPIRPTSPVAEPPQPQTDPETKTPEHHGALVNDEHNICTVHGGERITTRGGKSWHCVYKHLARR